MRAQSSPLARALTEELKAKPQQFHELVDGHRDVSWPQFLHAWGELRRAGVLGRDDDGNYLITAAPPPGG